MNKKTYMIPEIDTLDISMLTLMSGTVAEGQNPKDNDDNDDSGEITDPADIAAKAATTFDKIWED